MKKLDTSPIFSKFIPSTEPIPEGTKCRACKVNPARQYEFKPVDYMDDNKELVEHYLEVFGADMLRKLHYIARLCESCEKKMKDYQVNLWMIKRARRGQKIEKKINETKRRKGKMK